jgi:hypothetical protein
VNFLFGAFIPLKNAQDDVFVVLQRSRLALDVNVALPPSPLLLVSRRKVQRARTSAAVSCMSPSSAPRSHQLSPVCPMVVHLVETRRAVIGALPRESGIRSEV